MPVHRPCYFPGSPLQPTRPVATTHTHSDTAHRQSPSVSIPRRACQQRRATWARHPPSEQDNDATRTTAQWEASCSTPTRPSQRRVDANASSAGDGCVQVKWWPPPRRDGWGEEYEERRSRTHICSVLVRGVEKNDGTRRKKIYIECSHHEVRINEDERNEHLT